MAGVIAGIGLATSLIGSGVSFTQAAKAKREQKKAERQQKALMEKAKERAEKNFYETLNVPIDAFDNQYKQNQQVAAQALEALQQGDARNLAAGVGGLQAAASQANEVVRTGMQDALYENRKMKMEGKAAIEQQLIDMEVGAAADQAQMARDFGRDQAAGIQGGIAGVGQAAQSASSLVPLFAAGKEGRAAMQADEVFGGQEDQTQDQLSKTVDEGGTGMSRANRLQTLKGYQFTPAEIRRIKRSDNQFEDFKTLIEGNDPRFKNLQTDIGSVTDMSGLQKLLYGY
tara:strand:+ start:161 stop:1018 length:858 start_codon:yes stop_codon:yes gene_type:complete